MSITTAVRKSAILKRILAPLFALGLLLMATSAAQAQDSSFQWAPDFPTGSLLPPLQAEDQHGKMHGQASLLGENGLLLLLSRSFDWCPYCISQLIDLVEIAPELAGMGIHIAAVTYDPVDTLAEAAEDYAVDFPLLRDEASRHISALGILDSAYEPGQRAYGIPYPGIFLLDS
jgi:peroxiredoxin